LNDVKEYSLSSVFDPNGNTSENVFSMGEQLLRSHSFYSPGASKRHPIWVYGQATGIWTPEGEDQIRVQVREALSTCFNTHIMNEIVAYIKAASYKPDIELGGTETKIVCENGTLDMTTGDFEERFYPDEYHIARIPVTYDPEAKCPHFLKFLDEVTASADDREALIEFVGYCLFKIYVYEIIVLLVGEGANGKSILLSVIKSFLDSKNVSSVSPQQLEKSRFASAQLHGKLACISGDIPSQPLQYTGHIKTITGGDLIPAEHKNLAPFDFVNHAKLIFSANQVPETWDSSRAFFRRFRIIDFPNQFSPTDKNFIPRDLLLKQILSETEKSGILNLALDGLKRLRKQGHLTGETTIDEKRSEYVRRSDPAQYFFERFLTHDTEAPTLRKSVLYDMYVKYCHFIGKVPIADTTFGKKVKRLIPYAGESKPREGDQRITVWTGIGLDYVLFDNEIKSGHGGQGGHRISAISDSQGRLDE